MFRYLLCAAFVVIGTTATEPRTAAAEGVVSLVPEPLPLLLKDGKIAQVSVVTIPFVAGSATLSADVAAEFTGLVRSIATDCFVTAQAIGHVDPERLPDPDPMAAHRLARARADTVLALMAQEGLGSDMVAAVWDWQFMVPLPRVTLWIFRLNEGDGCGGAPLARDAVIANASAEPAPVFPPPLAKPEGLPEEPAGFARDGSPLVAHSAAPLVLGADAAETPPDGLAEALTIEFETDRSVLSLDDEATLEALATRLEQDGATRIMLRVEINDDLPPDGVDAAQSGRFNRWLAERRAARVTAWLEARLDRPITVDREFVPASGSRKVLISLP